MSLNICIHMGHFFLKHAKWGRPPIHDAEKKFNGNHAKSELILH